MPSQAFREADWYDTPLLYDIVFDEDTELELDFLDEMQRRHGSTRGRAVLEPACGSGRLVVGMARRGWRVTGLDLNEEMLDYTRERLQREKLRARIVRGDMASFRLSGRFDLAHCLVSTFKYLLDEKSARGHLRSVARALKPGGIYALGLHLSWYDTQSRVRERWVAERNGVHVVCNIQSWPPDRRKRLERVRSRLTVTRGGETRRLETNWNFRCYSAAQLRRLLRSVPELEHVTTYDFTYELDRERELDDEQLDNVLILRRRV